MYITHGYVWDTVKYADELFRTLLATVLARGQNDHLQQRYIVSHLRPNVFRRVFVKIMELNS